MSPRAQSAFPPPAVPASHAHLFHRRTASSSAIAKSPPSNGGYFAAASVLRRAEGGRVVAKEEVVEVEGIIPRGGQSDDGSVGSRDTPGPETPYEDAIAGDTVRRRSSASSTTSAQILRARDLPILSIPPFRGRKSETHSYSGLSVSASVAEEKDDVPRRSSGPSVFMIPAPAPITKPATTSEPSTTGLGIEGFSPTAPLGGDGATSNRLAEIGGRSSGAKRSLGMADGERTAPSRGVSTDTNECVLLPPVAFSASTFCGPVRAPQKSPNCFRIGVPAARIPCPRWRSMAPLP